MLRTYALSSGRLIETSLESAQVFVYSMLTDEEKQYLINTMGLDEHTLHSSLDPDELGRLEFEVNHSAAIVKRPRRFSAKDNFLLKTSSIGLFLFSDKLILVTQDDIIFEGRIFNKMFCLMDAFLKVIFHSIWHFEDHLMAIHRMSEELETEINRAMTNKDLLYMFNLEKSLVYYLNAIASNGKVIERIRLNAGKMGIVGDAAEFLEDVTIENGQCYEQANTYSQVLASLMDARASIINNNLNIRMKTLTIISLAIMLPTFIVSLFSMNVPLPIPQHEAIWPFWFVSGLSALAVAVVIGLSRFRRW
ncbi:MAG: magnesium transporter CorA family protein [Elusimicrobia bacterium]|nr:magnesium transporter CorA family protein [Elusimicrobiota bacterium]